MTHIDSPLTAAIDAWDARVARPSRSRGAAGAARRHRRVALADPRSHPLRRRRCSFRGEGLTTSELALRANVSRATIENIESGRSTGSDATFAALALALNCQPDAINPRHVKA